MRARTLKVSIARDPAEDDGSLDEAIRIARHFTDARRRSEPLATYPGIIPGTLAIAYRVQDRAIAMWNDRVVGWKVGRILPPLDERYGADRLAGPIFADQLREADGPDVVPMTIFGGGFGAVEAEFLLEIGHALDPAKRSYTLDEAAALVGSVRCGIEVASSPFAGINAHGPAVTASDFGNNAGLIVGPVVENWQGSGFASWPVTVHIDGVSVGKGCADALPDGPVGALRFLLELSARRDVALPVGTWVSTGAISGVHEIAVGQNAIARFDDRLEIACSIADAEPHRS